MGKASHYPVDWEKIKEEVEIRGRKVTAENNPYGYTLNVNNNVLNYIYEKCKLISRIHGAPSERQRIAWEEQVWKLLKLKYKAMYKYSLVTPVIGWQATQLEECVRCIKQDAFIAELYKNNKDPFKGNQEVDRK